MPHLGLVCPSMSGHLHPMTTLGRELVRRGHTVTVLALHDAAARVEAAGLRFHPIGERECPPGSVAANTARLSRMGGYRAMRFTIGLLAQEAALQLRDVAAAVERLGLDALLVDQTSAAAGTVAECRGLPFATVCNALMMDIEPGVPPFVAPWRYADSRWGRLRNRVGHGVVHWIARPVRRVINDFRRAHRLRPYHDLHEHSSPLAVISQVPAEFDFPRRLLRTNFHYVGPLHDGGGRAAVPFPYERLTGRPLIYASMGTLQNGRREVFQTIAAACDGLDAQLVLSLGGADPDLAAAIPARPLVVPYAPQLDLLQRAALTITHAGLNTVLESLACGVPLVAIPVTNDQPAVAARVEWTGAGTVIPPRRLNTPRLRAAVSRVLSDPAFRQHAQRLQQAIHRAGGPMRAADIVERAITTRQPVLPTDLPPQSHRSVVSIV